MIAVRLEPEIISAIEREADKEDRPVAAMTRILLNRGDRKPRIEETETGMKRFGASRIIVEQAV
ncbi:MAG: hypothetical protein M1377_06590 [Deltaproteobacteria bacterium]|nr:hypothetical protein [Deltaproteobacteria bacterium]MDA8178542.1 hypothetical protein [Deltaproteobacteria bacterium]